jgi:hypothetical protein
MMLRAGLAAGALALAVTGSASAASVVYTYRGTISEVYDQDGTVFGGAINVGDDFTAVYTLDDDTPGAIQYSQSGQYQYSSIEGYFAANPVLAQLTVGSFVFDFGNFYGQQVQYDYDYGGGSTYESFQHLSSNYGSDTQGSIISEYSQSVYNAASGYDTDYLSSGDYHSLGNLTSTGAPGLNWYGQALFKSYDYNIDTFETTNYKYATLSFAPTSVTTVPEPGTWAMMIIGIGAAGSMIRRRKALVA